MTTKKPKWAEYQTNGKSAEENYKTQRAAFMEEIANRKEIKAQLDEQLNKVIDDLLKDYE